MAVRSGGSSSSVRSLPPPCPKSPPGYPDLYGKRREAAKIQMLEREISFLEEELKSVEGLQPASRYCKEVTDFVMAKSDPLIPTSCICNLCKCSSCDCSSFHVNAAPATAVHVNAARATVARVQAAAQSRNGDVNATHATAVPAARSRNGDASAAHSIAVRVQAAARSRSGNVSRVLNPAAATAAETVAFCDSLHARIAFAADGNVLLLNVQRQTFAAIVQKPVVILAACYFNIFLHFTSQ
ncbi:hypothetical protein F3Y22_tig00111542pilonHSYRG00038 [Hibiscus syriacus]|uniref:G protein gamma domain-containing protein n=1 Tax=Hibiscus syriacus TaxID=106335 RepID=A0A6A2XNG0_HIBSY|nr:hypothetical protein F3Y22_tig00111542pilonHSYRG00038 [Hibiscus syriacus]